MKLIFMRAVACGLVLLRFGVFDVQAQSEQTDLTTLRIEDLMNLDVTSASKKEQKLSEVSAAIFVIGREDIRRSGATNIPDLLRMVPGLEVAQINPSTWAISARGFNGQYSTKLLVLIDGRTVYSSTFSGVYWDAQDVPLELIERIEIIRGPGAAVWGANAVNGVINILTRTAENTQSGVISAAGGSLLHGYGLVRYGGKIGSHGAYRLFADGFDSGHYPAPDGQSGEDDWYLYHGGFRADGNVSGKDSVSFEGEAINGNAGERTYTVVSLSPPVNAVLDLRDRFSGWSVLGRWKHSLSPDSETSLQAYFDRSDRGDTTYGIGSNTFDVDFQHHRRWGPRQDIVWGLSYRLTSDHTATTLRSSFHPVNLSTQIFGAFVQDELAIRPHRLSLSLGTKFEHEYYNGFNVQPTARATWSPDERDTFWAAVSGAQRTPSRAETGVRLNYAALPGPDDLPVLVSLFGNPWMKNERLIATEAGFRKQSADRVSFDLSLFFNQYRDLASTEPGPPRMEVDPPPEHLLLPSYVSNQLHGDTQGIEVFGNIKLTRSWTLSPGYTYLAMHLHRNSTSLDKTSAPEADGGIPNQQAQLRSNVNLPWHWQWTTSAYFVGRLPAQNIPAYTRLDTNLAWQPSDKISLGLVGQNLIHGLHQEYAGPDLTEIPSLIRRSGYARLTWRF